MSKTEKSHYNPSIYAALSVEQLREMLAEKEAEIAGQKNEISGQKIQIAGQTDQIAEYQRYIRILEEYLRLAKAQKFGASSEKLANQIHLFDEAELEVALSDLEDQVDDKDLVKPRGSSSRQRGLSPDLPRKRIELKLTDEEKIGASRTFFTKVKEELEFIPAQLNVLEYWQEKAVIADDHGGDRVLAATRPTHPLGKCIASTALLAQIITAKYADGLPLYRQEGILKRYGGEISRTSMAHWIIRLDEVFKPLINLIRETQNSSDYLQADETRMYVLKEPGKTAQSDKWMWVIRGGPSDQPSVLFDYDPSRGGAVPERLLYGFKGVLQADGYSGYARICQLNGITRIGCMDHARRKFVEATKAEGISKHKKLKGQPSKANVALSKISKLYRIETELKDKSDAQRLASRKQFAVPILDDLKTWLEHNRPKVLKGGKTYTAIGYMLNQWDYLIGYCNDGKLHISNVLAENAIRPFAVGRKAWLFADTPQGARASATCYSLIETAKANNLEPYAYLHYLLNHIGDADTLETLEALLPWNVPLRKFEKKVPVFDGVNRRI